MNNCFVRKLAETVDNNNLPLMPVSFDKTFLTEAGLLHDNSNTLEQLANMYTTDFIEIESGYKKVDFVNVQPADAGSHRCGIAIYDSQKNILAYNGDTGTVDLSNLSDVKYMRYSKSITSPTLDDLIVILS